MTELEKYQRINNCESGTELSEAVLMLADDNGLVQGRDKQWDATRMSKRVLEVIEGTADARTLTREYGIRQQALYIIYYTQPHSEKPDVKETIEQLSDLSKMFDDRISDCYQVKGLQQARHAFIMYRSIVWNAISSLKQI